MKKFIIRLFTFLLTFSLSLFIFTYIFSIKNNMSLDNTVAYFKDIINVVVNSLPSNETPVISSNNISNIDNNQNISTYANNAYYYEQLDSTGKTIYDALLNNVENLKKENYVIDFSTKFNDLLNTSTGEYKLNRAFQSALDSFSYDHPELFYIDFGSFILQTNTFALGPIKEYKVKIVPKDNKNYLNNTFNSEYKVNSAITKIENIKTGIINNISNKDIYNQILDIHDFLVSSLEYDKTISKPNIHNIYGAFIEQEVVCEGYAKAFKYLLDNLDIECILVSGTAINSSNQEESHMWNYVKLGDSWYGVDVTWDDPIIIGGNGNTSIKHNYFLKRNATFNTTHIPSGKITDRGMLFSLPTLSDTNYKW